MAHARILFYVNLLCEAIPLIEMARDVEFPGRNNEEDSPDEVAEQICYN
jgi:hypothetical protein